MSEDENRTVGLSSHKSGSPELGASSPTSAKLQAQFTEEEKLITTCKLLNCSPPQSKGNVAKWTHVKRRLEEDGFGRYFLSDDSILTASDDEKTKAIIAITLYGRDDFYDDQAKRKGMMDILLDESKAPFHRAYRVLHYAGDTTSDSLGMTNELQKFVKAYGTGTHERGTNCYHGHGVPLCRRVQKAGNCFLHASIVLAAIKEFMGSEGQGDTLKIVDMSKYVRRGFDMKQLYRLLILNLGGDSVKHLRILTSTASQLSIGKVEVLVEPVPATHSSSCKLIALLKEHGPALVSQFILEPRFTKMAKDAATAATPISEPPFINGSNTLNGSDLDSRPRHAMLLVGARFVANEWRVLLQNWWPSMPYVEVSVDYLFSCEAMLTFIVDNKIKIPTQFERCTAVYAEADVEGTDGSFDEDLDV